MDWLKKYADIPEAERIRRIAALVATAVARHHVAPPDRDRSATIKGAATVGDRGPEVARLANDPTEQRMLEYLTRVGAATPRDFQVALGLSPMTVTRRLARLRAAGLLSVEGHTRAVRYTLRTDFDAN